MQQELVVLHVLEQLDRHHPVVAGRLEFIVDHIARDHFQVGEVLGARHAVDVFFLRPRIGEGSDLGLGEHFGEVQ